MIIDLLFGQHWCLWKDHIASDCGILQPFLPPHFVHRCAKFSTILSTRSRLPPRPASHPLGPLCPPPPPAVPQVASLLHFPINFLTGSCLGPSNLSSPLQILIEQLLLKNFSQKVIKFEPKSPAYYMNGLLSTKIVQKPRKLVWTWLFDWFWIMDKYDDSIDDRSATFEHDLWWLTFVTFSFVLKKGWCEWCNQIYYFAKWKITNLWMKVSPLNRVPCIATPATAHKCSQSHRWGGNFI